MWCNSSPHPVAGTSDSQQSEGSSFRSLTAPRVTCYLQFKILDQEKTLSVGGKAEYEDGKYQWRKDTVGNRPREGHPRNNQHSPPGAATLSQGPGTVTSWKGRVRPGRGAPMCAPCSPSVWGREPPWLSRQGRGAGCLSGERGSVVRPAGHPPLLPATPHSPRGPRAGLTVFAHVCGP